MKPSAQLTGSLLARKGFAMPSGPYSPPGKIDALGFDQTALTRSPDHAPDMLRMPARQLPVGRPGTAKTDSPKCHVEDSAEAGQVAMTLRLDPKRHKRLRLMSVHSQRSARDIITAALDLYMDQMEVGMDTTSCECLRKNKP